MKLCKEPNCTNEHHAKGYCCKHYWQHKRNGDLEDITNDTNEIIEYDDYAEVVIYNKDRKEIGRVLIDLEGVELVKNYKWYINSHGYVRSYAVGSMHRLIIGCPEGMVVDHINHNRLDNRKCNLRICTHTENNRNQNKQRRNTSSQYKGVCWNKKSNKWQATITINKRYKYLGLYESELEASIVYDRYAIMYYKEYAYLNHPIESYIDYILELGLNPHDFIR